MHEKNCTIHTLKNPPHLVTLLGKIHALSIEVLSRRPIFAEFRGQYQSAKIKVREIVSYFFEILVLRN